VSAIPSVSTSAVLSLCQSAGPTSPFSYPLSLPLSRMFLPLILRSSLFPSSLEVYRLVSGSICARSTIPFLRLRETTDSGTFSRLLASLPRQAPILYFSSHRPYPAFTSPRTPFVFCANMKKSHPDRRYHGLWTSSSVHGPGCHQRDPLCRRVPLWRRDI